MIKSILAIFRRRQPVVVNTYRTRKDGDWIRKHFEKHRQLAAELGRPWPEKR